MSKRAGFSLIELMCVMVLLAVIGLVFAHMIQQTLEVERTQSRGFDRLLQCKTIADQFRADVAQAVEAPADWEEHIAGPHTLILKLKSDDHVIYRWRQGKLQRDSAENGLLIERTFPLSDHRATVEFVRLPGDARLIQLRLPPMRHGKRVEGQTLEFTAALGGDWR